MGVGWGCRTGGLGGVNLRVGYVGLVWGEERVRVGVERVRLGVGVRRGESGSWCEERREWELVWRG